MNDWKTVNGVERAKMKEIKVTNARQNNLKGINVKIPFYQLSVVTGNSGSGKSSLVYDTIYAESQRLMCESLIDNIFGMKIMDKPDVESIENLCPAISISQASYNFNPNSTVNTYTDISSHIKAIFSIVASQESGKIISPRDFAPLQSQYQCPECHGTGKKLYLNIDKIIPDKTIPLCKGGIIFFKGTKESFEMQWLNQICSFHGIDWNLPVGEISKDQLDILMNGDNQKYVVKFERGSKKNCQKTIIFEGVWGELGKSYKKIHSPMIQQQMAKYLEEGNCKCCNGSGFSDFIYKFKVCGYDIGTLSNLEITELRNWCLIVQKEYGNSKTDGSIIGHVTQILHIVDAMQILSIEYLTPSRSIPSLSGGEFQRLRLARQISGSLAEILYILDEPCKGLHRVDVERIINVTRKLIQKGNTVLAIEHNNQYIANADNIISLGPGSGPKGGYLIQEEMQIPWEMRNFAPNNRRTASEFMTFEGIRANNIYEESCKIPVGAITCITGVSGSGKSTLAEDVIYQSISHKIPCHCLRCAFPKKAKKVFYVDQKPIGQNARSSVVSYLKINDEIRNIFANVKVGKKVYPAKFFSANVEGGRCEKCSGSGVIQNKYLPDSYMTCDECEGLRFQSFILDVKYKGKSIADVLNMDINEALELFSDNGKIVSMLSCIKEMGLEYLKLGQLSKNLSGGEAQRLKLAKALGEEKKAENIYILDEPTSGLSDYDIDKIARVIQNLADNGNTILMIEHNVKFISQTADYIIDFGFHGGKTGGRIMDQGYIEDVYKRRKASIWFDDLNNE